MMIVFYSCMAVFGLYLILIGITLATMSNEEYAKHRELVLHPKSDYSGNTTTSIIMKDGHVVRRVKCSIGATKRLLNNVWN